MSIHEESASLETTGRPCASPHHSASANEVPVTRVPEYRGHGVVAGEAVDEDDGRQPDRLDVYAIELQPRPVCSSHSAMHAPTEAYARVGTVRMAYAPQQAPFPVCMYGDAGGGGEGSGGDGGGDGGDGGGDGLMPRFSTICHTLLRSQPPHVPSGV